MTLPVSTTDAINAAILAVSEDKIQGFQPEPLQEISRLSGIEIFDDASLRRAGEFLLKEVEAKMVVITQGPAGMTLFTLLAYRVLPLAASRYAVAMQLARTRSLKFSALVRRAAPGESAGAESASAAADRSKSRTIPSILTAAPRSWRDPFDSSRQAG